MKRLSIILLCAVLLAVGATGAGAADVGFSVSIWSPGALPRFEPPPVQIHSITDWCKAKHRQHDRYRHERAILNPPRARVIVIDRGGYYHEPCAWDRIWVISDQRGRW